MAVSNETTSARSRSAKTIPELPWPAEVMTTGAVARHCKIQKRLVEILCTVHEIPRLARHPGQGSSKALDRWAQGLFRSHLVDYRHRQRQQKLRQSGEIATMPQPEWIATGELVGHRKGQQLLLEVLCVVHGIRRIKGWQPGRYAKYFDRSAQHQWIECLAEYRAKQAAAESVFRATRGTPPVAAG